MKKETDWNNYYKKKSVFSIWAQAKQRRYLFDIRQKNLECEHIYSVCEMGGADSCFFDYLEKIFVNIIKFIIIDNSEKGIEKFNKKQYDKKFQIVINKSNLLDQDWNIESKVDFTYSLGLVEHFKKDDTALVIQRHFESVVKGGFVLFTFPTPTLKYRFVRKIMEIFGVWQFWDERPLICKEVEDSICKYGNIIEKELMKKMALTQMVYLCRKK